METPTIIDDISHSSMSSSTSFSTLPTVQSTSNIQNVGGNKDNVSTKDNHNNNNSSNNNSGNNFHSSSRDQNDGNDVIMGGTDSTYGSSVPSVSATTDIVGTSINIYFHVFLFLSVSFFNFVEINLIFRNIFFSHFYFSLLQSFFFAVFFSFSCLSYFRLFQFPLMTVRGREKRPGNCGSKLSRYVTVDSIITAAVILSY